MEREKIPLGKIGEIATYKLSPILGGVKILLLIRPRLPGNPYTELGSYKWAGLVKQKALDLGWTVIDLAVNEATRENVENKINEFNPNLIIHYDYGNTFSLYGQNGDNLEVIIDEDNVGLLKNRIISTVSALSANGLGFLAITNGAISYLGYTKNHFFIQGYEEMFGEAANAANYALLECNSVEGAYQAGINAYNDLINDLVESEDPLGAAVATFAMHDRDCFVRLGSGTAAVCFTISCKSGLPEFLTSCRSGLPEFIISCKPGLPLSLTSCIPGLPDSLVECHLGLPDSAYICRSGLPYSAVEINCRIGGPDSYIIEMCAAGPLIQFDLTKLPAKYQKPFKQLLEQIKKEQ